MAEITLNKSLLRAERPLHRQIGNIAYYAFVACFFWAASQLIGLIFNASGVLEHLIQHQSNLRPEVLLSPATRILFGAAAFLALGALVLALAGGICWYQRRRAR